MQTLTESVFRRPPIRLLLLAAVAFLLGSLLPPVLIAQMKPLPTDLRETYATRPADTLMLAPGALADGVVPEENRARPECGDAAFPDVPYSCLVLAGTTHRELSLTTGAEVERGELDVEADTRLLAADGDGGRVIAELRDLLRLSQRSTYPVSDPVSRVEVSVVGDFPDVSTVPFVREGLQYFFPFPPERRSYPRYDMIAETPLLLDYVGEVEREGLETFEFHHTLVGLTLTDPDDNRPRPEDPTAKPLLPYRDLATWGMGTPRYAVERTVWVEPKTGTLVDTREQIHIYFAADATQAEERAFTPSPEFTVFHTSSTWDEATQARQHAKAADVVSNLRALQVFAVVAKAIALLAVLWAVVLLLRERREPTS